MISLVGNRIPCFAPNKARLFRPLNFCMIANNPHHPAINANWTKVSVTGALNVFRICFAELFDRALDIYHNRHRTTNLSCVDDNDSRSLNSWTKVDIADAALEDCIISRPAVRVVFGENGICSLVMRNFDAAVNITRTLTSFKAEK